MCLADLPLNKLPNRNHRPRGKFSYNTLLAAFLVDTLIKNQISNCFSFCIFNEFFIFNNGEYMNALIIKFRFK